MEFDQSAFLERCAMLEGAELGDGAFATGPALWVGKREVAHFDEERTLDVRLTKSAIRERRDELRADPRVALRASPSDWLEVILGNEQDVDWAYLIVADAVAANLPTAPPGLPPSGSELQRRRRFH